MSSIIEGHVFQVAIVEHVGGRWVQTSLNGREYHEPLGNDNRLSRWLTSLNLMGRIVEVTVEGNQRWLVNGESRDWIEGEVLSVQACVFGQAGEYEPSWRDLQAIGEEYVVNAEPVCELVGEE